MTDAAIIIFARRPVPGRAKTRLCPPLSADEAATLYGAMQLDVLETCQRLHGIDLLLFHDDAPDAREFFTPIINHNCLFPQEGSSLGERLENAFALAFHHGYQRVAVVGTDSPDLPRACMEEAFRLLKQEHDAVFGPTDDGGYYLVGLRKLHPHLFRDIPWSTEEVLQLSLRKCDEAGLRTELLPRWYDLDTAVDLKRFSQRGAALEGSRTRTAVESLMAAGRL